MSVSFQVLLTVMYLIVYSQPKYKILKDLTLTQYALMKKINADVSIICLLSEIYKTLL